MIKKMVIWIIKTYHNYLSPLNIRCCRFYPSCSCYTIDAIEKHGLASGLVRGAWRILRCNPLSKGGYDPA